MLTCSESPPNIRHTHTHTPLSHLFVYPFRSLEQRTMAKWRICLNCSNGVAQLFLVNYIWCSIDVLKRIKIALCVQVWGARYSFARRDHSTWTMGAQNVFSSFYALTQTFTRTLPYKSQGAKSIAIRLKRPSARPHTHTHTRPRSHAYS